MGKKRKGKTRHTHHKGGKRSVQAKRFKRGAQAHSHSHSHNNKPKPTLVVAYPTGHQAVLTTKDLNPQQLGHYTSTSTILLVGEGNFTFAAALATKMGGHKITATGLDTKKLTLQKYEQDAKRSLSVLCSTQAETVFEFDATQEESFQALLPKRFDFIVFNFPHIGGSTEEDVLKNKAILRDFFAVAPTVISKRGEIHVTLRDTSFYRSWNVEGVASGAGLRLVGQDPFDSKQFASLGYIEARTNPGFRQAPTVDGNSLVYRFRRKKK